MLDRLDGGRAANRHRTWLRTKSAFFIDSRVSSTSFDTPGGKSDVRRPFSCISLSALFVGRLDVLRRVVQALSADRSSPALATTPQVSRSRLAERASRAGDSTARARRRRARAWRARARARPRPARAWRRARADRRPVTRHHLRRALTSSPRMLAEARRACRSPTTPAIRRSDSLERSLRLLLVEHRLPRRVVAELLAALDDLGARDRRSSCARAGRRRAGRDQIRLVLLEALVFGGDGSDVRGLGSMALRQHRRRSRLSAKDARHDCTTSRACYSNVTRLCPASTACPSLTCDRFDLAVLAGT